MSDLRSCTGCSKPVCAANKTGLCRSCHCRHMTTDSAIRARQKEGLRVYFSDPVRKAAHLGRLAVAQANLPEREIERRREMGRSSVTRFHTPDMKAKALAARMVPEVRARRGRAMTRTLLPWCPEEFWPLYRDLTRKGFRAAEARAAIEPMIPGTEAHAKRLIANTNLAMRLKHEREKAQAY